MQNLRLVVTAVLLCIALLASGCAIGGFVAKVFGAPPQKAAYIPSKTPMLVLVRDMPDPSGLRSESDIVSREIESQLTIYKIAPLVPAWKIDEVRRTKLGTFDTIPPQQLGQEVGASQVLFVQILNSSVAPGPAQDMVKGEITTSVSIIDVATGKLLFPNDGSNGATVSDSTPSLRLTDRNTIQGISKALHAGVGAKIVRLFRRYKSYEE